MDDWRYSPPDGPLRVIYDDRDLVAVDKPSGLLSIPGRGEELVDSALQRVILRWPTAQAVHRLDLDTSGLLVFATRGKAARSLMAQLRERAVQKRYVAWVDGELREAQGLIDLPLSREAGRPRSFVDPEAGRPSRTRYAVAARAPGRTLLDLWPETGRSHQLRVHLMSLGHVILGDRFYGDARVAAAAPRLMLHAQSLRLAHPFSGAPLQLEAPPPGEFSSLLSGAAGCS
jgi:tRNA pseudouridine32 synthase/23S rRNA pseudouridine746 synthase